MLDALALTASAAVACAVERSLASQLPEPRGAINWAFHVQFVLTLIVATITWTLGLLVIADPHRLPDAVRSPGKLALMILLATSVVATTMNWGLLFQDQLPIWLRFVMLPFSIVSAPGVAGCAAIAGWLTLRLTGTRRRTADWLEVSGMIVAWIWILFGIASPLRELPVLQAIGLGP